MKKLKNQKGFTGLEVILIVAVVSMIVGAGVYAYAKRQAATSTLVPVANTPKDSQKVSTPLTDEEQILKAANCDSKCTISHKQATLADVVTGGEAGGHVFLAKENDKWNVIYEGNGDVPSATVQKYNIPDEWLGPQL